MWDIINQVIKEEADPKKGKSAIKLNPTDPEVYPIANLILLQFKNNSKVYFYDRNVFSILGRITGNINIIKRELEESEITKSYITSKEAEKIAIERLRREGYIPEVEV